MYQQYARYNTVATTNNNGITVQQLSYNHSSSDNFLTTTAVAAQKHSTYAAVRKYQVCTMQQYVSIKSAQCQR
eukprot:17454-Heterococcus_DN1.PRE.3